MGLRGDPGGACSLDLRREIAWPMKPLRSRVVGSYANFAVGGGGLKASGVPLHERLASLVLSQGLLFPAMRPARVRGTFGAWPRRSPVSLVVEAARVWSERKSTRPERGSKGAAGFAEADRYRYAPGAKCLPLPVSTKGLFLFTLPGCILRA